MYKPSFGTRGQIKFANENAYFEFLGYLCKNDGTTTIVWEPNDEQGAWGPEGRIHFHTESLPKLQVALHHTRGRGDSVHSRVNCNEFVLAVMESHGIAEGAEQDQVAVRATVPDQYVEDFDRGLNM